MGKTVWMIVRIMIACAIVCFAMKYIGISWKDVTDFFVGGLKSLFEILEAIRKTKPAF